MCTLLEPGCHKNYKCNNRTFVGVANIYSLSSARSSPPPLSLFLSSRKHRRRRRSVCSGYHLRCRPFRATEQNIRMNQMQANHAQQRQKTKKRAGVSLARVGCLGRAGGLEGVLTAAEAEASVHHRPSRSHETMWTFTSNRSRIRGESSSCDSFEVGAKLLWTLPGALIGLSLEYATYITRWPEGLPCTIPSDSLLLE